MITRLTGTIHQGLPTEIIVDVQGVGYGVTVPLPMWEELKEDAKETLHIFTYVREQQLDLFGFTDVSTRLLFTKLLDMPGIGPRMALELCAVPRSIVRQALDDHDSKLLTNIKGIGKKMAEKLLVEFDSLAEKHPALFAVEGRAATNTTIVKDEDAIAALSQLGYNMSDVLGVLETLPKEANSTEKRVAAALKQL